MLCKGGLSTKHRGLSYLAGSDTPEWVLCSPAWLQGEPRCPDSRATGSGEWGAGGWLHRAQVACLAWHETGTLTEALWVGRSG